MIEVCSLPNNTSMLCSSKLGMHAGVQLCQQCAPESLEMGAREFATTVQHHDRWLSNNRLNKAVNERMLANLASLPQHVL